MEKQLTVNLSVALNYVENAHEQFNYYITHENKLNDKDRETFYLYGREKLRMNLVRLSNIKKSILAILGNKRMKNVDG